MQTAIVILVVLLGTLALPVVAGAVYQAIETWRDCRRLSPPGRLVQFNPTDCGFRIRHGRVLLELDAGAATGGTVLSRGEL
jgi:hypothetical protein